MRLARHLEAMPGRPPSAREILLALIDAGDVHLGPDGQVVVTFTPDAATLDALMCFDAIEREDERLREEGEFYGSGCRLAVGAR
jgi:hypothetical protein